MKKIEICNLPLPYFLILFSIIIFGIATDTIGTDIIVVGAFLYLLGGLLYFVGDNLPIVGKYLGGSLLLPLFGGAALIYFEILPEDLTSEIISLISSGFLDLILSVVIVASILSIDKDILFKTSLRLIPCILGAHLFIWLFLFVASGITGHSVLDGVYMIGLPNFGGGSSGGLVALPSLYSEVFGVPATEYAGKFIVYMNIANIMSVLFSAIIASVGNKYPNLTGNGKLLKHVHEEKEIKNKTDETEKKFDVEKGIGIGCIISIVVFILGRIISAYLPFLNYVAWATLLAIVIKLFNFKNETIVKSIKNGQGFMVKTFLPMFITGIGIANVDLENTIQLLSPDVLFIVAMGVLGAIIGSIIFAKIFKLHIVDAAVGIGCNCAALGSSGTITVLSTTKRMALMPYATIVNRIGGAIMLIAVNLTITFFA